MSCFYVAFYEGADTENEYEKFSSDEEAIAGFLADGCGTVLEIYECNDDETLSPKRRVYPSLTGRRKP